MDQNVRPAYFDDGTIQILFQACGNLVGHSEIPVLVKSNRYDQAGIVVHGIGEGRFDWELKCWYIAPSKSRKLLEDWWHAIIQKVDQSSVGTLTVPYPGGTAYTGLVIVSAEPSDSDERYWFNYTIKFAQSAHMSGDPLP